METPDPSLREAYLRLCEAETIAALFTAAAAAGPGVCGFERCVVAEVRGDSLTTAGSAPVDDPGSEALRRVLAARALVLEPRSEEAEYLRRGVRPGGARRHRPLASSLGLRHYAFGLVAPEQTPLALLILDRATAPPVALDLGRIDAYAALLGVLVERLLQRQRISDVAQEIRLFAGTVAAIAQEATRGTAALYDSSWAATSILSGYGGGAASSTGGYARLSDRERPVAEFVARGWSNREIAAAMALSPETVKSHVASILRKLGAANRVEAATRLLRDPR